ncbi:hypothetical protein [Alicyclobacillus fodiniaquatilis]|uniref:Uncharacterized protein n=1 Tax=Alicyclobacillus fodiniaquatilis TaxID=1661150 RepID=A0ABW4JIJ5_9BACL
MRKRLWSFIPIVGITGILNGCGGGAVSSSSSRLDPAEKVTVSLIENGFVLYQRDKLKPLVTSNININSGPSSESKIAPGNAWLASVSDGPNGETVYVYLSPQMVSGDQLMKYGTVKQGTNWLVHNWNSINVPQLSFSDFQKSPEYQSIGITHWTEVKIE